MAFLRLLLAMAVAAAVAARGVEAKRTVCRFSDPCSGILLSGRRKDVVVSPCGTEWIFSISCLPRRALPCKIKDQCKRKGKLVGGLIKGALRGAVVQDRCKKTWRVTPTCKLAKTSKGCFKLCLIKSRAGKLVLPPGGKPLTCAVNCKIK